MEDGPEVLDSTYTYGDRTYQLEERSSEQWHVFDGQLLIGILKAVSGSARRSAWPDVHGEARRGLRFTDEITDD